MSHIMEHYGRNPRYPLGKPYGVVTVEVVNRTTLRVVSGSLSILKPDVLVTDLNPKIKVIGEDGEEVKPFGRFMITIESFDPCHGLIDYREVKRDG